MFHDYFSASDRCQGVSIDLAVTNSAEYYKLWAYKEGNLKVLIESAAFSPGRYVNILALQLPMD